MKKIIVIIILSISIKSFSQVEKINVKKEINCNFKLNADSTILGKKGLLSSYSFDGVTKTEVDKIRDSIKYFRMKAIIINQENLEKDYRKICETKKSKLYAVNITKTPEKPVTDTSGILYPFIRIHFSYIKKSE
jgi:hypothetical protein